MDSQTHWERIYGNKAPDAVSCYRPHLEPSLELIRRAAPDPSASIIDVGGGESTLVDDLIARGYENITVLDISRIALTRLSGDWERSQVTSIGLSPISLTRSLNMELTTYGMIALYFIF